MPLLLLSGEGPNACTCGHGLPGTNHFEPDLMPWTKCPACGLFYVLEDGEVAVFAPSDLVVTP